MFDIQHDAPVPIHEQIASQIRAHIASGALKAGARLAEHRSFAQALLANPQMVARAYDELQREGVLAQSSAGGMEVTAGANLICRIKLQDMDRERLRQAVAQGLALGLAESEIVKAVEQALAAGRAQALAGEALNKAIKKPTHECSHRDSQGIQDLSRQSRSQRP